MRLLHPDKTRLIEFGRNAIANRRARGLGKPETFDFLGFKHFCATRRDGSDVVLGRKPMAKRMRTKLREIKEQLMATRHEGIDGQGKWLAQVLRGWMAHYAVPMSGSAISAFRHHMIECWHGALMRRSQRRRLTWTHMKTIADRYLPFPRILHQRRLSPEGTPVRRAPREPVVPRDESEGGGKQEQRNLGVSERPRYHRGDAPSEIVLLKLMSCRSQIGCDCGAKTAIHVAHRCRDELRCASALGHSAMNHDTLLPFDLPSVCVRNSQLILTAATNPPMAACCCDRRSARPMYAGGLRARCRIGAIRAASEALSEERRSSGLAINHLPSRE
jgi:hypothetical protein